MIPPRQPLRYKTLGDRVDKLKGEHIIQQGYNKPSFTTYRQPPVANMDSDTPHPTSSTSGAESITNRPTYRQNHPQIVRQTEKVEEKVIQQRLEVGTPQQDQITNKEKLVKAQNASINQQAVLIDLLERIQPKDDQQRNNREIEELITLAKEGILSQQANLEQSQAEISQSKQVATYYSPSLSKPDVYEFTDMTIPGTREALQPKNIKAAIDTFNPDKHPEADFADTWRQILLYVKDYKIDSAAYMTILSIIIQGSASRLVFEMRESDTSIFEMIKTLGDLYAKRRTIMDDVNDINQFKRKPNEPIHTAMQRAKMMAERIRHLWPKVVWDSNKRMEILLSILRQIISVETRKHIEYEEMKYWKTGTTLEYTAMLDLVETFETTNNHIPTETKKLVINICTGVPNITENSQSSFNGKPLEVKRGQINQFNKKINALNATLHAMGIEPMQIDLATKTAYSGKKRRIDDPKNPQGAILPLVKTDERPILKRGENRPSRPREKFPQKEGPKKIIDTQEEAMKQFYGDKKPPPQGATFGDKARYPGDRGSTSVPPRSPAGIEQSRKNYNKMNENYYFPSYPNWKNDLDTGPYVNKYKNGYGSYGNYRGANQYGYRGRRGRSYSPNRQYGGYYAPNYRYPQRYNRGSPNSPRIPNYNRRNFASPDSFEDRDDQFRYRNYKRSGFISDWNNDKEHPDPKYMEAWSVCPQCKKRHRVNTICPVNNTQKIKAIEYLN
jgi:hypothetical protein